MPNIIAATVADGRFATLIRALTAAGMVDTLSGSGPFTLFAPTDDAFDQLPDGLFDGLLSPAAKDDLTRLLTRHVTAGRLVPADLRAGQSFQTLSGDHLLIQHSVGCLEVNGIAVELPIEAANGFIYPILTGLLPAERVRLPTGVAPAYDAPP